MRHVILIRMADQRPMIDSELRDEELVSRKLGVFIREDRDDPDFGREGGLGGSEHNALQCCRSVLPSQLLCPQT